MKPIGTHNYYVYFTTNITRRVLYIGVTENLARRLWEHRQDAEGEKLHFAGKYNCIHLIYWERYGYVAHAIAREKQLKGWKRSRKVELINSFNPEWRFLNEEIH
jgi:putative endonuclease